jgi:hypothetical protein
VRYEDARKYRTFKINMTIEDVRVTSRENMDLNVWPTSLVARIIAAYETVEVATAGELFIPS